MKNLKKEVIKIMFQSLDLLKSDDYPEAIIFETLKDFGMQPDEAKFLAENYSVCDSINRRRRLIQEENISLRDKDWGTRKRLAIDFKQNLDK